MNAKERRALERIVSHQAATLYLENGDSFACTIEDFCDKGMYISFAPGSIPVDSTIRIMRVSFKNSQGRELFVNAEPAHLTRSAAGLRFLNQYPDAVAYLKEHYAKSSSPTLSPQNRLIIERCLAFIDRQTASVYQGVMPRVVEAVKEEAVRSSTDQDANKRMSIAERLEKYESTILAKISSEILKLTPLGRKHRDEDESSLNLVEKGEFEDWLICKVLSSKLEQNFRSSLLLLKMRTDSMGYRNEAGGGSPLGPDRLVYAFHAAIHPYLSDLVLERRAFKVLETALMPEIEALAEGLNEQLTQAGILVDASLANLVKTSEGSPKQMPKVEPEPSQESVQTQAEESASTPSASSKQNQTEEDSGPTHAPTSGVDSDKPNSLVGYGGQALNHDGIEQGNVSAVDLEKSGSAAGDGENRAEPTRPESAPTEAFSSIGKLFRKLRTQSASPALNMPPGAPVFSPQELHQGLSTLHGKSRSIEAGEASLLDRVLEVLNHGSESPRDLDEGQKDQVDIVDRFFGSLQHNPRLTPEGKQHLFRLEIPVLRQLLENERFFDDQDSPLRDVLNRIAKLGAQGGRLGKIGHQKIEQLVARINDEYDQNHAVVGEVRKELDELIARQHALYLKNVERVAAAADGAHKVDEARKYVASLVSRMLDKQKIPQALESLLESGWLEHLNLLLIKHGKDSSEFSEGLSVIEALKQFGQNPEAGFDARRNVPLIQDGLKSMSGGVEASKNVREQLKQLMLDAPEKKHVMVEANTISARMETEQDDREKTNLEKSKELRPWLLRAKSIPLNAWLRFQKDGEQEPQFIRLVWIARAYTKFVFVNHQGLKVIELGAFKFAEYLKRGQIVPDPEFNQPIVKQGLDDMVKEVYDKLAFDSSHDKQSGLPNEREFQRRVRIAMKKGERTQQCCLYYVRALSGELSEEHESQVVAKLSEILTKKRSDISISGRVNRYDFLLFVTGMTVTDVVEDFIAELNTVLSELKRENIDISVMRSEVWGYLGFNNESSLLKNAKESLRQMELQQGEESRDGSSRVELPEDQLSASAGPLRFSASDSEAFEVYVQEVRKLSETELPENFDLKCKVGDSAGEFFEPETEEEARELNSWWLGFAARALTSIHDDVAYRIPLNAICLTDDAFKDEFKSLLDCTDMPPERIWFDLYNCSALDNEHFAASVIRELQICGCHFSLQGYGTSDCPARLLQSLPVDLIAIDAEVFKSVNEENDEEPLVNVAHHFDKAVLVSKVDSAIMLQKLEKQGVDFIQGERVAAYRPY